MALSLVYRSYPDHLTILIAGQRTPGVEAREALRVWGEVARICLQEGLTRVLCTMRVDGWMPADQMLVISRSVEQVGFNHRFRLAIVAVGGVLQMNMELSAMFLREKGFDVEVFARRRVARKWLLSSS